MRLLKKKSAKICSSFFDFYSTNKYKSICTGDIQQILKTMHNIQYLLISYSALVTTVVNSENYPDESSMENNMPVSMHDINRDSIKGLICVGLQ